MDSKLIPLNSIIKVINFWQYYYILLYKEWWKLQ